jgi:hypothetical protein
MNFNLFAVLLFKVSRATKLLSVLLLLLPAAVQAQDAYSTNADGSIYTYSTNADGSANIVAYAGPPWVVTIPTNINGLTVTSIGTNSFETNIYLTSVTIPGSVTSIGDYAFFECSDLTNVTIPNSVTNVGQYAFARCYSLTSVTIPNSVTGIGDGAFEFCYDLTSVTIGNSVTSIGNHAFADCISLTSVTIPNSVTSIGSYAFFACKSLTGIYFQGNSPTPTNDSSVFSGYPYPDPPYTDPATVYYLPGTTGWGAMFDGLPTASWFRPNLQILNNGDILIQFSGGVPGTLYDVEESSNLLTWTVAATNPANAMGSFSFKDTATAGVPMQFYRVRAAFAFTVGGTLAGLPAGDTVTLQDNGGDNLTLSNNGTFTFSTALPNGQSYSVTVSRTGGETSILTDIYQPVVSNGSGTISGANVTNVAVQCTPIYTGYLHVDMYNAAALDGTANGGVPGVMLTEKGGPFRVTASGRYSRNVAQIYATDCVFTSIVGTGSCSSTTFPSGTPVIQFGTVLECGFGPYHY